MANRSCEHCGEDFKTLSKLRLHECPEENNIVDNALTPEPKPDKFPSRVLETEEFDDIRNHSQVEKIEKMIDTPLPGNHEAISFVVQIDGHAYGLHCDHDTAEWAVVTSGEDFSEVKKQHSEWLADDIGKVTGNTPNPENLDIEVPDTIITDCDMCEGTHELTAQPDSFASSVGFLEYEGYCDETNHPLIETRNPDEFMTDKST
ncbi:hypothetical protein ACOZ4N_19325 [Halorientalis pallida]|uniref:hypothetical protein n=1 Tax=Halorientalis pallida TaxID=2479928 RepID=UPI003C6EEB05